MTTHSEDLVAWREGQLAALTARLQPVRRQHDGTIYTEPSGIHFHVITKSGPAVSFWLVEQANPTTGVIQSEIDLDEPLTLVEPYSQAMTLCLLWQPQPQSIYVAGLGGGRLPLVLYHALPDVTIYATEIDPAIITLARLYFGLPDDERMVAVIEDGRVFLELHHAPHDLILVDVFLDNGYTPYRLSTREFFTLCRARLRPGGVVVVNLLAGDQFLADKVKTALDVFAQVWLFTLPGENTVLYAADTGPVDKNALSARARQIAAAYGFAHPFAECADVLVRAPGSLDLTDARVLVDADPPPGYFDHLPSFATPFGTVAADLPCPCGSGLRYAACHGAPT